MEKPHGFMLHLRSLLVPAVLLSLALAYVDSAAEERWPTTVDEAVQHILATMPETEKARVKNAKKEELIEFHHGWGTGIRNTFGLWGGNTQLMTSACGQPCHPDAASMIIMEAVWAALQK